MNRVKKRGQYTLRPQLFVATITLLLVSSNISVNKVHTSAVPVSNTEVSLKAGELGPEINNEHTGVLGLSALALDINSALNTANESSTLPEDCGHVACLALTFDDGPDPSSTPKILDALNQQYTTATFFLIGNRVVANPAIVKRIYQEGFAIGNHSWAHPDFTRLTAVNMQQQIDLAQNAFVSLGIPAPQMFRPPYGSRNNLLRQQVKLPIIMWNVDPKDWREKDPNRIAELAISQAKPGAILLLHDREATAAAIPRIVSELKTQYRLVSVPELLNLTPASQGEFFGR